MRTNLPVTQREFEFPADATLMSTTDTHSRITYANAAFVAASGFDEAELLGQHHNIVRHPDMPPQAFEDMWRTLKAGNPWTGVVKNRRKNGDHYWVRANVTPLMRDGRPVGFMSVRTQASRAEIAAAEALYAALREGRGGAVLRGGLVVRGGTLGGLALRQTAPVRWRIRLPVLAMAAAVVSGATALGLAATALAVFGGFTLGIAALGSLWMESQISRPLEQVLAQARRISTGETCESLHMNRIDEIGMTLRTINQLGLMFRWIIDDVSQQVLVVQSASGEIAQGNSDLSDRTEQTAANLEQTAASMEQMSSSVRNNAQSAQKAAEFAAVAAAAAAEGGSAVGNVNKTMSDITDSSRKIGDIVGLIDSIAFQTNILALNAAVEAARAGEQGRGFAVVASEVRRLAHRSTEAARDIRLLIQTSVGRVEHGVTQVTEAARTMSDIVSRVEQVNHLIDEIGTATREQTTGITQVTEAVSLLDQATQQNAAMVEQAAAAAQSLKGQADQLGRAVAVFRSGPQPIAA